jgi:predicted DNA-binding transcriptional regulator AlpA
VTKSEIEHQQLASSVVLSAAVVPDEDAALTARAAADFVGLALPSFWRQVAAGWLPSPFYSAPRAPRWRRGTLREACEARRQMPRAQKEQRRQARLVREREAVRQAAKSGTDTTVIR